MAGRWIKRRDHSRRLKNGRIVHVSGCYIWCETTRQNRNSTSKCPYCGAAILTIPMSKGGWGHFEGGKGLSRIKHPCFTLGAGMSRANDKQTPDLFEITAP